VTGSPLSSRSTLAVWLQLLRAPNLLTVPGDPLAGYFLAAGTAAASPTKGALIALASLCLYMAGLLFNDYADQEVDRHERPQRPLPAGLANPHVVVGAAAALVSAGISLAFIVAFSSGWLAIVLAGLIGAYDFSLKKLPVIGPVVMGSCRGLSLLMGAYAGSPHAGLEWAWMGGLILAIYIAVVTQVARGEMATERASGWYWGPGLVLVSSVALLRMVLGSVVGWPEALAFVPAVAVVLRGGWQANRRTDRAPIPPIIGQWIGALILLQAAFMFNAIRDRRLAALMGGVWLGLWIANRRLVRWFYAS
jgi:4-hydroxybenzoate polyprenyltransferase